MPKLNEVISFRSDKLFQGAIDLDWLNLAPQKSNEAALAYVFHGPNYHGITQASIGTEHGYTLKDTVSFVRDILSTDKLKQNNLNLVIAGYGAGKSHLALTLSALLKNPGSKLANAIIESAVAADKEIGKTIKDCINNKSQPSLVVALNGMQDFDLTSEFNKQLIRQLKENNIDTKPLDDLKPRFQRAKSLILNSNEVIQKSVLKEFGLKKIDQLIAALDEQDESAYCIVHEILKNVGTPIQADRGESLKDIIVVVADCYCGENKPFSDISIIFDEFGRYTEFATTRSQIAGSGVLQQLYEGMQSASDKTLFIGFIQYELNSYVKRLASEYQNDIQRYITRFQSARKSYISSNLETLIANLIEKIDPNLIEDLKSTLSLEESEQIRKKISSYFPRATAHALWQDSQKFHEVIRVGCWPLSPFSV